MCSQVCILTSYCFYGAQWVWIAQSKMFTSSVFHCPKSETASFWNIMFLSKQMLDKVQKKKTVSVKFSHGLFSLLDFMNLEDGTDRSSRNIGKELPLNTTQYLTRAEISQDDSLMEALVWLHMVQFGVVQFDASYMNLRRSHIFQRQI